MKVAELCIMMLTSGASWIECEGKNYNNIFEFNVDHGNRTIRSAERLGETGVRIGLEEEDWLRDIWNDTSDEVDAEVLE